jgi:hypothetical protein
MVVERCERSLTVHIIATPIFEKNSILHLNIGPGSPKVFTRYGKKHI